MHCRPAVARRRYKRWRFYQHLARLPGITLTDWKSRVSVRDIVKLDKNDAPHRSGLDTGDTDDAPWTLVVTTDDGVS